MASATRAFPGPPARVTSVPPCRKTSNGPWRPSSAVWRIRTWSLWCCWTRRYTNSPVPILTWGPRWHLVDLALPQSRQGEPTKPCPDRDCDERIERHRSAIFDRSMVWQFLPALDSSCPLPSRERRSSAGIQVRGSRSRDRQWMLPLEAGAFLLIVARRVFTSGAGVLPHSTGFASPLADHARGSGYCAKV